jgi:hypothetical protein
LKKQNVLNTNHSFWKIFSQEDIKTSEPYRKKRKIRKTQEKEKD